VIIQCANGGSCWGKSDRAEQKGGDGGGPARQVRLQAQNVHVCRGWETAKSTAFSTSAQPWGVLQNAEQPPSHHHCQILFFFSSSLLSLQVLEGP